MILIEKKIVHSIKILQSNQIEVCISSIIEKDNVEIAKTFHRNVLCPGDNILNENEKVQLVANLLWTNEVINNYKLSITKNI